MRANLVGWGWRTPLGPDVEQVLTRLLAGERAACTESSELPDGFGSVRGARVAAQPSGRRHRQLVGRLGRLAIECAREAVAQAGAAPGDRLGLFAATGGLRVAWRDTLPALAGQQPDGAGGWARGLRGLHPFWLLRHLSNVTHAELAIELGARGEGATFGGWNAGAQAIAAAVAALQAGAIDTAVVVAHDSMLDPEALVDWTAARIDSTSELVGARIDSTSELVGARIDSTSELAGVRIDSTSELVGSHGADRALEETAAPYGCRSAGSIPGEAAAALVLVRSVPPATQPLAVIEAVDGADGSRSTPMCALIDAVLGRLLGPIGCGSDCTSAGVGPAQRTDPLLAERVVDGAGWGDHRFDDLERRSLARWVAPTSPLIALQAQLGQLGAAASLVQTIALAGLLRRGELPPVGGLREAAAGPLRPLLRAERTSLRRGVALAVAPPGLLGAVAVEVPS